MVQIVPTLPLFPWPGNPPHRLLEVVAERLRADDFCFSSDGTAYIATHPGQSLLQLRPNGQRTTVADAAHGMVGATAVAFGRAAKDRRSVYVTTTGGTWTVPTVKWSRPSWSASTSG